jgi:hexosaminidase
MASKWSSPTPSDDMVQHPSVHSNIAPEQPAHLHGNEPIRRNHRGQPTLPKYIHLDLKGAPPQADQFYDRFFHFVDGLKMGVRGVLIEYEDMLPLRGRLSNVNRNGCEPPFDSFLF